MRYKSHTWYLWQLTLHAHGQQESTVLCKENSGGKKMDQWTSMDSPETGLCKPGFRQHRD